MRYLYTLICVLTISALHAQSLAAEDAYLRSLYDQGALSLDQYRDRAESLRKLAEKEGGYPAMPVDSLGRYEYVTSSVAAGSGAETWSAVRQWLALTGYAAADALTYSDPATGRLIVKLEGAYLFTDAGRRPIAVTSGRAAGMTTVAFILDLLVEEGEVTARWLRPEIAETELVSYDRNTGGGLTTQTFSWPTESLLPLTQYRPDSWDERLQRSKMIQEFVEGLAVDLDRYLAAELP
ncbi:uncharacterized protein with GYD domain [Lewinella marina]|uniref:Uncharacterized protein n=1 Tax=Neolewinella marina TaxID=438751 RepID=A0A2G0CEX6_9BACT|nr:hypothetical protein [Neolewinella marina]NJB85819.1 uncharacterized protein with GYD domain [Neolewinella marina]PHK98512.1 hypothetical protein CGL56_08520 [Neolewinella marina]